MKSERANKDTKRAQTYEFWGGGEDRKGHLIQTRDQNHTKAALILTKINHDSAWKQQCLVGKSRPGCFVTGLIIRICMEELCGNANPTDRSTPETEQRTSPWSLPRGEMVEERPE